jgi:hypothetical protein
MTPCPPNHQCMSTYWISTVPIPRSIDLAALGKVTNPGPGIDGCRHCPQKAKRWAWSFPFAGARTTTDALRVPVIQSPRFPRSIIIVDLSQPLPPLRCCAPSFIGQLSAARNSEALLAQYGTKACLDWHLMSRNLRPVPASSS